MSDKNVLLIIHDVYQDYNHFPLGPGYIASYLEKEGMTVEIYPMDVYHYSNEELTYKLKSNTYDIIGVGYMAARFTETIIPLCKVINEDKKDAWFILGGHGPTPTPEYVINKTRADIVVMGEAEEIIPELVKCKLHNGDLHQVKGIVFKYKDDIINTGRRNPIKELDSIPFPAWHLFPMDIYINCFKAPGMNDDDKIISIITSRGCINKCNFCYRMEKGIRLRSISNVIDEIKMAINLYGITYVYIQDELFVVSEKRVLEFERLLKENDIDIKYAVEARVDIFNEEIAKSLKRSGCVFVNIGFESGTQEVLDEIGKNTTVEQNINTMRICKEIGLPVGLNFIWGFENDNKETLQRNVELIKQYNLYHQLRTIRPVTPYPGTPLYYKAIKEGLLEDVKDFYNKFKNSDLITVNFTKYPVEECYRWLLDANTELVRDHYFNVGGDMEEAEKIIQQFSDLYSGKIDKFRGVKIYDKKQ